MKTPWKSLLRILIGLGLIGSGIAFLYSLAYVSPLVAPAAVALLTLGISYVAFRGSDPFDPKPAGRAEKSRKIDVL